ncbi:hypothetical protein [Niabella sp.]|uniref:hypothetical protein n=1 Tax=Niabella sp. TaxID=1962976 RepID=UPI002615A344|nr:hypothetical protein [Niabella sp.]
MEPPEMNTSSIRPVGEPVSDGVIGLIGPNGGVLQSEDGRLEVEFPAGAVTEETEIGIEPLKNTALSGIGFSYRLTPHGKTFQKKVTLRFHYKTDERRIAGNEALEIAYQNDKGIWTCIGNSKNDKINKTINVQTSHFSDWALVTSMELSPVVKTVGPGESISLKALQYVFPASKDDFLVPLMLPEAGTGEPLGLQKEYIKKWTLDGPGKLTGTGNTAVYTAPSTPPPNKTATITLELNVQGKQVLLISTIYIITEGIEISIDGGAWKTYPGIATSVPETDIYSLANLRISAGEPQITFMWPKKKGVKPDGIYPWSMLGETENHVIFEYTEPDFQKMYVSVFNDGLQTRDSGGFFSVDEKEEAGQKFFTGMFGIDQAGLIDNATGDQIKVSSIMGLFKVRYSEVKNR